MHGSSSRFAKVTDVVFDLLLPPVTTSNRERKLGCSNSGQWEAVQVNWAGSPLWPLSQRNVSICSGAEGGARHDALDFGPLTDGTQADIVPQTPCEESVSKNKLKG